MADTNNFGNIQENFERITDMLDSIRAQNAMNSGDMDKVLANINIQLETLSNEENSDLIKVFLAELKRSLEERHNFVSSKFTEIETSFNVLAKKAENQLEKSELKEVFEIIATNLNVFAQDFTSQKEIITDIGLKIEEIKNDESQKKDILRNIAVLKMELEKFSNGFESIILNLNDKFKEISELTSSLDSSEALDGIKKDIENIFLSSNAVLSTLQVIDRKNRELEEVINHVVTKEDFNVEREQVAKLIAQNLQITDYISTLPTQNQVVTLSEKVDGAIGVIDALKNMLSETGKQNQELLSAQLDSLESKILNISTEEEFIGFRKELAEFSQEVIQSTNLMRADLTDTNEGLKGLMAFLSSMDIQATFENFANLTKISEKNVTETVSKISEELSTNIVKNRAITKTDVETGVVEVKGKIDEVKNEISETSKSNLSNILEHIQSVVNNIFSVKNAIHIESQETAEAVGEKLENLKEGLNSSSNFMVQRSQENMENIVANVEKVFEEIQTVKEGLAETTEHSVESINSGYGQIFQKITEIKSDLNQSSQENFANILSIVEDFAQEIEKLKTNISESSSENFSQITGFVESLSEKLASIQDTLTSKAEVNAGEIKGLVRDLALSMQSAETNLGQSSSIGFSGLKSNLGELAEDLKIAQENFDIKSQANLSKIVSLFEDLTREFNAHKEFLSDSTQVNFETLSLYIQNLNQRIDETKKNFSDDINVGFSEIQSSISVLPETIKENQLVFENEKKALIEENSRSIVEMSEKVQNLVKGIIAKDSPFKSEVLFEFSELKTNFESIKEELKGSNQSFEEGISGKIDEYINNIQNIEDSISGESAKYSVALNSLQNKLVEYFDSIQESTQSSDLKMDNSLRETSNIKSEIRTVLESISELKEDPALRDLSEAITEKFEGILIDIASLEDNLSNKNSEAFQNIMDSLDGKFADASRTLEEFKNYSVAEKDEFLTELAEKTELLKGQINLTGTDVLMNLNARASEIVELLSPISESVNKVSEIDFEQFVLDIKKKIDSSAFSITSSIKEESREENAAQSEKISDGFENISEKINDILSKVSVDNSDNFEELKSLLDSVAQKVDVVSSLKEHLLEKFNVSEDILIQSQEDAKAYILDEIAQSKEEIKTVILDEVSQLHEDSAEVLDKITQSQNETKTELIDEISQRQNDMKTEILSGFADKIDTAKNDFSASTQTLLAEELEKANAKDKVLEKLDYVEDNMLLSQTETKTEILNGIKENIAATKEDFHSSVQTLLAEELEKANAKDKVLEKLDCVEDNLLLSQTETKTEILNGIKENIAATKEDFNSSVQTLLAEELEKANAKDKVLEKLDYVEGNLLLSQTETKTEILNEIKENIAATKEDFNSSVQTLLAEELEKANAKDKVLEKLDYVEDNMLLSQTETKTEILNEIKENITATKEDFHSSVQTLISSELETSNSSSRGKIFEKLDYIKDNLIQEQSEAKEALLTELQGNISSAKDDFSVSTQTLLAEELEKSSELSIGKVFEKFDSFQENFAQSQDEIKTALTEEIVKSQENIETTIIDELQENINFIKGILNTLSADKSLDEEISSKIEGLNSTFNLTVQNLENKLNEASQDQKTSSQMLISEVKTSFYEKVDDSLDELRSFIELLESQKDTSKVFDDLKFDILEKVEEYGEGLEKSISLISVKSDLEVFSKEVETSINDVFGTIEEKFISVIEGSESINAIKGKSEELERRIEEFKKVISEDITEKLDGFELSFDNQTKDFSAMVEELKTSLAELKENYVDLSLNSTMEMSAMLVTIQEKLDSIGENISGIDFSENFNAIETKISELNFDEKFDEIGTKLDAFNLDIVEDTKNELTEKLNIEFEGINQKLDAFNLDSDSGMEDSINEIKEIVNSQSDLLQKLDDLKSIKTELSDLNGKSGDDGLEAVKTQIKDALESFEEKLDILNEKPAEEDSSVDIKDALNTFKEELFENLVEIFSQISFVEESEDIKDFVEEKTDEIKAAITSNVLSGGSGSQNAELGKVLKSSLGENFNDILSSLDILHEKTNDVDNNLQEVKNHLESSQSGFDGNSEYTYTLQDIESDIAKVRMILKELSESKTGGDFGGNDSTKLNNMDKLNEDIMSISTRTNKLLLNSDESYNALKDNLGNFRDAIYQFEEKVKYLDNSESISRVEKKVEEANKLALSCVKSDKIFNQTFMYLAEWVDTASENLGDILEKTSEIDDVKKSIGELKKSMPKTANIEIALDKIAKKFDTQQDKIKSLEEKVEKLAKSKAVGIDVDAVVEGILAKIKIPEAKADAKLTKKVDSIDKQLTKLGKSIEKITSYVD